MKIALANKYFFQNGGSESVFLQERDFLLSSGVDVVDFSMDDYRNITSHYSHYFVDNKSYRGSAPGLVTRTRTALSLIHSTEAVRKIKQLIVAEKPDILHCHNIYHQLTPSVMKAAKTMGVKVVLTLHDYKVVCPVYTRVRHGELCSECLSGNFINVVRHRCCDGSLVKSALLYAEAVVQKLMGSYDAVDRVIVPSKFMADSVTRWRFPKDRVTLLYNGVEGKALSDYEPDKGYILFLGRLSPEKGLNTLGAAQAGTAIQVVIAGTGPMEVELRRRFPGLQFVGHQSRLGVEKLIRGAAAIVVPSEWYENCPMSLLEGMSFGKAVIGSCIGGTSELISDGETGVLFEPGNVEQLRSCMMQVLADPVGRRRMGRAGRDRLSARFSQREHNRKLVEIYQSLLCIDQNHLGGES